MDFFFVALGGALGAAGRYAIGLVPIKAEFPFLTLMTNLLGAVLIGFVIGMVGAREDVSPNTLLFWKTGVCSGFTTFSAFSLEAFGLLEQRSYMAAGAYIALSCMLCLLGVLCGKKLAAMVA